MAIHQNQSRILIVGDFRHGSLEESYACAFESEGATVERFALSSVLRRHTRFGRFGRLLTSFYPLEAWINKANRELVLSVMSFRPHIIIVSGAGPVRVGSLAQIRARATEIRLVLLWPDTLLRILPHVPACLPLYDLVASYAQSAIEPLRQLGARRTVWVPLGADLGLYSKQNEMNERDRLMFSCDVSFVGNHRPEREQAILALLDAGISVKVWGENDWRRVHERRKFRRCWQGRSLYCEMFAKAVRGAKVSLNPIDPTNYPAANMRFFEVPACGGVVLNSSCPEMELVFEHGESAYYYKSHDDMVLTVKQLLADPRTLSRVGKTAQDKIVESHTYNHRARQILEELAK